MKSPAGRLAVIILCLDALRLGAHYLAYHDAVALVEIGALDAGAIVLMMLSFVIGPRLGTFSESVKITVVVLGLPLVLFGFLAEKFGNRHLSLLMAFAGLSGIGAGMCAGAGARRVIIIAGLLFLAGAVYGLTRVQEPFDGALIWAPYCLVSLYYMSRGMQTARV